MDRAFREGELVLYLFVIAPEFVALFNRAKLARFPFVAPWLNFAVDFLPNLAPFFQEVRLIVSIQLSTVQIFINLIEPRLFIGAFNDDRRNFQAPKYLDCLLYTSRCV